MLQPALILAVWLCVGVVAHPSHAVVAAFGTRNSFKFVGSSSNTEPSSSRRLFGVATPASEGNGKSNGNKRIVLVRHGCTHMNEYLSVPGTRWGDANFTDIFDPSSEQYELFRDSPLSPRGIRQAQRLSARLGHLLEGRPGADVDFSLGPKDQNIMNEIELIACSPLSRALQTVEVALLPHIDPGIDTTRSRSTTDDTKMPPAASTKRRVPILALPLASERVYLISDYGRNAAELSKHFPYVDFDSEIETTIKDSWWFTQPDAENYVEWRPIGEGQTYACLGEPEVDFNRRMMALYDWLSARPESTIGVVCHWGVIDWLIGEDFENCEMRVVDFESMKRTGFMLSDAEAAEIFAQGERCVVKATD